MIIGITGGTGCGKTTLLALLQERGAAAANCDAIYRELLESDPALLAAIAARFPGTVSGGRLDRKALGRRVFANPQELADLNGLTHAAVAAEVRRRFTPRPSLGAIDAIALFESGLDALCDRTVAVCAPEGIRVRRLMARDGISESYARSRIAAQRPESWFLEKCGAVLENSGTEEEFRQQCLAFLRECGIM